MSHIVFRIAIAILATVLSWQLACDASLNISWPACSGQSGAALHSHPVSIEVLCGTEDTKIVSSINCLKEDPSTTKGIFLQR